MLSLLVTHMIITIACLWSGYLFYNLVLNNEERRPIVFYAISGLILFTTLVQVIVLFLPIGLYIKLVTAFFLLLLAFLKLKVFKEFYKNIYTEFVSLSRPTLILFFFIWFVILLINAGPTMMDDTESYHIQSIKWIQEYGSVPGLVNLHERFGFNSSWFSSVALFGFSSETTGGFTALNSIQSMWLCYWLISKYNQLQKEKNQSAAIAILAILFGCLLIWPLVRGNAATANYDFIATVLVLILLIEKFLSTEKEISPSIEWVIWPAYLLTVRIINFPLLLISVTAIIIFIKQKRIKTMVLPIACCLLLIIPFIIRNIIISGYPFYPAIYFDLANVDWKPDPQMTERLLEYIKYYNRVSTTYLDIEQTKALGSAWAPKWFKHLFLFDKALLILGVSGIVLTIAKLFTQRNKRVMLLMTNSLLWLILWFFISPDPRFIYGVLLFGVFLVAYHLTILIKNESIVKMFSDVLIILTISAMVFYFVSKPWKQKEYRNWIKPAQLPQPPVKEIVIDNITFRIPEPINNNWNSRCYGTELPCLYKIDPRLKARGKNIRSGFHLEK